VRLTGLNGTTIEPLVPLLTFIGSIELDTSIDDKQLNEKVEISLSEPNASKTPNYRPNIHNKKKGLHR